MPVSRTSSVASFELVDEQLKGAESLTSLASYEVEGEAPVKVAVEEELEEELEVVEKVEEEGEEEELELELVEEVEVEVEEALELELVEQEVDDVEIDEEKLELLHDAIQEAVEEVVEVVEVDQEQNDLHDKLKGLEELLRKAELEKAVLRIRSEEEKDALLKKSKLETEELLKKSKLKSDALLKKSLLEKEALLKKANQEKAELMVKSVDEKMALSNKARAAQLETMKIASDKKMLEEEIRKREKQATGEAYLKKMAGEWVLTSAKEKNLFMKELTTHKLPYRLAALFSTIKCKMVDDELRTVNTLFGKRFNRNRLTVVEGGLEFNDERGYLVMDRKPVSVTGRKVDGDVMTICHTERERSFVLKYRRVTRKYQKITSMLGIAYDLWIK